MQPNTLPALSGSLGKKQIAALVQQSVESALDEGNVAQVAEALAVMESFVNGIRKDERFIDGIRDALLKNHGMLKTASGARIEACEGGITYDYSENPGWCYLTEQIAVLTEQRKELVELYHLHKADVDVNPMLQQIISNRRNIINGKRSHAA